MALTVPVVGMVRLALTAFEGFWERMVVKTVRASVAPVVDLLAGLEETADVGQKGGMVVEVVM